MLNFDLFPIAKGVGCELGKFDHYLTVSGNGSGGGGVGVLLRAGRNTHRTKNRLLQ